MEKRLKEAIVYTPDISKAVPIRMSDDWKEGQYIANANGHVNVCHFSDTFIIYVHYLCRREAYWLATPKYEPYPLLLGEKDTPYCPVFYQEHQIYLSFLQICMDFFCQSIIAGIPDFVAHGFLTGLTEMNPHNIGSPVNLLHQCRNVLSSHSICRKPDNECIIKARSAFDFGASTPAGENLSSFSCSLHFDFLHVLFFQ